MDPRLRGDDYIFGAEFYAGTQNLAALLLDRRG